MFRVFIVIAWAVLLVLLLYLWADVREIAGIVKENKRELLRSNLSGRAGESFPNFQEEKQQKSGPKEVSKQPDGESAKDRESEAQKKKLLQGSLNAAEERVLDEVLTEFLG